MWGDRCVFGVVRTSDLVSVIVRRFCFQLLSLKSCGISFIQQGNIDEQEGEGSASKCFTFTVL